MLFLLKEPSGPPENVMVTDKGKRSLMFTRMEHVCGDQSGDITKAFLRPHRQIQKHAYNERVIQLRHVLHLMTSPTT